jgi:hypothetical protein
LNQNGNKIQTNFTKGALNPDNPESKSWTHATSFQRELIIQSLNTPVVFDWKAELLFIGNRGTGYREQLAKSTNSDDS